MQSNRGACGDSVMATGQVFQLVRPKGKTVAHQKYVHLSILEGGSTQHTGSGELVGRNTQDVVIMLIMCWNAASHRLLVKI